ncbi:unnamed protein product [Effrenium voratum]|nr:unnamed protein product [Effrenium voratum]|mmetsp:Transcript_31437/g.74976  ORF Transcript_31437/g.74976 Transcript_31437/m.74976 type:complete len:1033 (+) Transcript_31437:63-3161(+)
MSKSTKDSIQQRVCQPIVNRGLDSLRRIKFFSALKEPCLRMIAAKLQVCFLAPEEVLAREGERVDRVWFMGKGTADAVILGKKVETYFDGAVIGPPLGLLMEHNWDQTVTTTAFSDFMVLTCEDLQSFFSNHESEASRVHAAAFRVQVAQKAKTCKPKPLKGEAHKPQRIERHKPPDAAKKPVDAGVAHFPVAPDQSFAEESEVTQNVIASWLDEIEFFSGFDVFSLERLLALVQRQVYKQGQNILTQGEFADALHVIYAGNADVAVREKVVATLGPKSIVGERSICVLGDNVMPCAATISPATSLVITYSWLRSDLLDLFIQDDRIYEYFKKRFDIQRIKQGESSFRNINIFQKARPEFVHMLESRVSQRILEPEDLLFEQGKPNPDALLLCEGQVSILKDGTAHALVEVSKIDDAVLFGEFNVLGLWRAPKATVRAVSRCVLKVLISEVLQQCFVAFPDESNVFRQLVEKRLRRDASKEVSWTVQKEEKPEEFLDNEFRELPRFYVRQFTKDYDTIVLPRDLSAVKEFSNLPREPLTELAGFMKPRIYLPQQVILQQGEDLSEILVLQWGACSVEVFGADLQPMEGPSIVGGMSSLMTKKVFTTITAEETCFVGAIPKHRFAAVLDKYPDFRRSLLLQTSTSFKRLCDDFQEQMLKTGALRSQLLKMPFLSDACPDFISQLASSLEPRLLLPGQSILRAPDEEPKLYFVFDGHLHVMKNGCLVCALPSRSVSGVLDVFGLDTGDQTQIKTDEICKVGTVVRKGLFGLLEKFPQEREKFEQLLHGLLEDQVSQRLLRHPIFKGMPSQFLKRLGLLFERKLVHPRTTMLQEGESGATMVVINVGKADIIFRGLLVSMLWSGKSFGGAQMMGAQRQYHATLRTKGMCHVLLLSHERFCTLTPPGPKRPWVAALRLRAKSAHQQELKLFRQKYMQHRMLDQTGVTTAAVTSAMYGMLVLQQALKAWHRIVSGETCSEGSCSPIPSRRSSVKEETKVEDRVVPAPPLPPPPTYPLLFSRALRPIRLVCVMPGKKH